MKPDPLDFWIELFAPLIMTLGFALISWFYARMIVRRGRPLTPVMRGMLKYGSFIVLGALYLSSLGKVMRWPLNVWVALGVGWGVVVGVFAWWWHKRKERAKTEQNSSAPQPLE